MAVWDNRKGLLHGDDLRFNSDGTADKRSAAVKRGDVIVTNSGHVDRRSSAVRDGNLSPAPRLAPGASERRKFTEAEKQEAWEKLDTISGINENSFRTDKMGNLLQKSAYGKDKSMGWNIDHSKPLAAGGTYHKNNQQALQASQNKSKGGKYPYNYSSESRGVTPELASNTDLRSQTVRNGELHFKPDGTVDRRSSAVRSGKVLVTNDGRVDARSASVRRGETRILGSSMSPSRSPSVEPSQNSRSISRARSPSVAPSGRSTSVSPSRGYSRSPSGPLTKSGRPDMRYKANRG